MRGEPVGFQEIDRAFGPAEYSSVTDFRDNIHWFRALDEPAYIFNSHVLNVNPGSGKPTGRVYLDPHGEKISGGRIRARRNRRTPRCRVGQRPPRRRGPFHRFGTAPR